ncbi:MAG: hypothetical protein V2A74_12680, partial [bacterium]
GYTVEVNGRAVDLPAQSPVAIKVKEGTLSITVKDKALGIPDEQVVIQNPFLTRPFVNNTYVINPDRVALLYWVQTTYSKSPDPNAESLYRYHIGDNSYVFKGVDYVFKPFPEEISISSDSSRVKKERVDVVRDMSPQSMIAVISDDIGEEQAIAYAKREVEFGQNVDFNLNVLGLLMDHGAFVSYVRPRLEERPVNTQWHRVYQIMTERKSPDYSLEQEYRQYVAKDPDNAELLYLLGRVVEDRDEADRLFKEAAGKNPPSAYAYNAMAFARLDAGDFQSALELSRKAQQLDPQNAQFSYWEEQALLALGSYDILIEQTREKLKKSSHDVELMTKETKLVTMQGHGDEAREIVNRRCKALSADMPPQVVETIRTLLESVIYYCEGNLDKYVEATASLKSSRPQFGADLTSGKLDDADKFLSESKQVANAIPYFLVYLAAVKANRTEMADKQFQAGVAKLREGDSEERLAAAYLSGEKAFDAKRMLRLAVRADEKIVLLAVFGTKFRQARETFFSRARTLNYDKDFPHYFLREIVGGLQ